MPSIALYRFVPLCTKQDYGVFVTFYGGISGLIHVGQLGLAEGIKPSEEYGLGQV